LQVELVKNRLRILISAASVAIAVLLLSACAASGYSVYGGVPAFSDDILFSAKIIGGRADYAYKRMKTAIDGINAQVSATRADSDIARLNAAAAGERVRVGSHTYALFNLALEYYELTDGAFNCAVTPLARLWRVDPDSIAELRPELGGDAVTDVELPSAEQTRQTLAYCDPRTVTASESNGEYYLTKSDGRTMLDFGGVAKGYAVDICADILDCYDISSALIDISGNAYFYGRYIDGGNAADWNVGVLAPRPRQTAERGYVIAFSEEGDASAVTSGDYMRYYTAAVGGETLYVQHIIGTDGVPVGVELSDGGWRNTEEWVTSATVIGESSALCDALATAVCVLGAEDGGRLLKKVGYKGLIFTEKRYTIIGNVPLYKPDIYNGYTAYGRYEL